MESCGKHWSITLMTILSVIGIATVGVGIVVHADLMSLGIVVTMTGTGVQLIRSHFAQQEQAEKLKADLKESQAKAADALKSTEEALAEKVKVEAEAVAKKVLEEAKKLADRIIAEAKTAADARTKTKESLTGIKEDVAAVAEHVNGGRVEEVAKETAKELASLATPVILVPIAAASLAPQSPTPTKVEVVNKEEAAVPVEVKKEAIKEALHEAVKEVKLTVPPVPPVPHD